MTTLGRTTTGPVGLRERAPAPDLARGFMLLLIALANTPFYLYGQARSDSGMHPSDASGADGLAQAVIITGIDLRVYPMFAFLFGYGLVMIQRRQLQNGTDERGASRLLQRRNLWMIVFGAVHALLLWGGDVMGAYGVCGLLLVWLFLRRRDVTLLVWSGVGVGLLVALSAFTWLGALLALSGEDVDGAGAGLPPFVYDAVADDDPIRAAGIRMVLWVVVIVVQGLLGMAVPVAILLGFWAARRRVLEQPQEHRGLLWSVAIGGLVIGWSEGLLHALAHLGLLPGVSDVVWGFAGTQVLTGLACGLGYVAVFGLIGIRLRGRRLGVVGRAVTAVGKRSMTCYLAQSVLCAPVLAAWGLGLGEHLTSATMALYAVGVWLVIAGYAVWLDRTDRPGPAEALLRRLTYRTS